MSKSKRTPPSWAFEDNPYSKFGLVYVDMLKSELVQNLPPKCFKVLICCITHWSDEKQKECLYNTLKEYSEHFGKDMTTEDINDLTYNRDRGYFVFPRKQYENYGLKNPSEVSRYLNILKDLGFIRVVWQRTSPKKPNIYAFSTEWKRKKYRIDQGEVVTDQEEDKREV